MEEMLPEKMSYKITGELKFFFFTCVALAKAGLVVGPLRPSVRPLVCPQHFWGA